MGRSKEALERRKLKKRKWKLIQQKKLKNDLKNEKAKNVALNRELDKHKKCKMKSLSLTSVTRNNNFVKQPQLLEYLPNHTVLSEEVVNINDQVLGEGSFGIVKLGFFKTLDVHCAVKTAKNIKHNLFNAVREARVLAVLQGCKFFPYVYGVINNTSLVMEILTVGSDCNVLTVYKAKTEGIISVGEWLNICHEIALGLKYMHCKSLLHNDLKTNNIVLKPTTLLGYCTKIIDMGMVTKKSEPKIYNLTEQQKIRYNNKYPYLAHELRNVKGSATSFSSDIYSLGYIFNFIADGLENFLMTLRSQMLDESPSKRPNIIQIVRYFENRKT